jgi:hypothetical protein
MIEGGGGGHGFIQPRVIMPLHHCTYLFQACLIIKELEERGQSTGGLID